MPGNLKDVNLKAFRGDNAFVWQTRGAPLSNFVVSALWAERKDSHQLLRNTHEDGAFGVECLQILNRLWSRDLIDSLLEMNFLLDHIPTLEGKTVVDVGAGYGRLLTRMADVTESTRLYGVDGVAMSTAICRAYVRYRQQDHRIGVLSLKEADEFDDAIDLAINVHSFSEMHIEAVRFWLGWLRCRSTRWLFIVPNRPGPSLNDGTDLLPHLDEYGFELEVSARKYSDQTVGDHSLFQGDYYLFRSREETHRPQEARINST